MAVENSGKSGNGGNRGIPEPLSPTKQLVIQKHKIDILADHLWRAKENDGVTAEFLEWLYNQLLLTSHSIDSVTKRLWLVAQLGEDRLLEELSGGFDDEY